MSAKELRNLAAIAIEAKIKQEEETYLIHYQECKAAMEKAAREGRYELYWQRYLPQKYIDTLTKDGFLVRQANCTSYSITWYEG